MLRKFLEMVLLAQGFAVTVAENADQARVLLADGTTADLLFSDVRMAGSMDGLQLARWAREHRPAMAVLLQTGFTELLTGDFTVLLKPYAPEELLAAIAAELHRERRSEATSAGSIPCR